jgi:hypothetical protein
VEAATDRAESLARRVAALKDPAMRIAYVRHELAQLDPGELCDLLAVAAHRADTRQKPHVELLLAMAVALDDDESARQRREAVAVAAERGQSEVVELLSHGIQREDASAARVPDFGTGRPLTLGERKALARKNDRELIARVLRDPHPDVIRILLGNPALVERDVVRLCARRPVSADVIREVFRSPRWMVRYEVRRAIVLNPYSPLSISMRLSRLLTRQDAHRVAESGELHADLRAACRRTATGATIH